MRLLCLICLISNLGFQDEGQQDSAAVEKKPERPIVKSIEDVEGLGDKFGDAVESVAVLLQDRETLEALAERFPKLKKLSINYRPNGAMPEGAIAELTKFSELESLVLEGDPQISDDEVNSIGQLRTLRHLKLALP